MSSTNGGDDMMEQTWQRLVDLIQSAITTFKLRKKYENVRQLAIKYPLTVLALTVFLVVCSVPLLCFVCFAVISTLVTFCGFLFVEGLLFNY